VVLLDKPVVAVLDMSLKVASAAQGMSLEAEAQTHAVLLYQNKYIDLCYMATAYTRGGRVQLKKKKKISHRH